MKKILFGTLFFIMIFSLLGASSTVSAAGTRLGAQFDLFSSTPSTFQAGAPFHFAHGWWFPNLKPHAIVGLYEFYLEVDGVRVNEDFVERSSSAGDIDNTWVVNFPNGLPVGTHTFTGHFTGPCQPLADVGLYTDPCVKRNQIVELPFLFEMTVDFHP